MGRDLSELVRNLAAEKKRIDVAEWLDELAEERAGRVVRGTHGPKFAHSGVPNAGVTAKLDSPDRTRIGTHSLDAPAIDTFCNAADLGVGVLLDLAEDGESLSHQVASGDSVSLIPFSDEKLRVQRWMEGLSKALEERSYVAHTLTKQLYFPVDEGYHMISPMHATSLTQAIHEAVRESKFSDAAKAARTSRKGGEWSEHDVVNYTRLATMKFGGAQPQNVSLLNSRRRGNAYLLSCAPPTWREGTVRLPRKGENALWRIYDRHVRSAVNDLRRFLSAVDDVNNVRVRNRRSAYIDELVDELLSLGAGIRRVGEPGWSRDSDLPISEQCFLDPARRDEESTPFSRACETGEWKKDLSATFGRFVNDRLKGMKTRSGKPLRDLGQVEADTWSRELRNTLSYLRDQLELLP